MYMGNWIEIGVSKYPPPHIHTKHKTHTEADVLFKYIANINKTSLNIKASIDESELSSLKNC